MLKEKVLSIVFYSISTLILLLYIIISLNKTLMMTELIRILLLCSSCLFLYFGGLKLSKYKKNKKALRINLWIFFILYIILLITLTLFDESWGRNGLGIISATNGNISEYLDGYTNLIPFKTILGYINEFNSLSSTELVLFNLFGNFIAFMPFAFFLPLLFKNQKKFKSFLITMFLIILSIEFIQLIKSSGRFDVDDIILNLSGALLMFQILKINSLNNLIKNIFLLEKNKINKHDYLKIFICTSIIVLLVVGLIIYRKKIYSRNLEEYIKINNPTIEIIDKSNSCDSEQEKFYEDGLFVYYYPCRKIDNMYIRINDEKPLLLQDVLNDDNLEYNIDIYRIVEYFDNHNIEYIRADKYSKIKYFIEIRKDAYGGVQSPEYDAKIEDNNILSAKFDYQNSDFDDSKFKIEMFLVPKKAGITTMHVTFRDCELDKEISRYSYEVKVDNKLNITYFELTD